MGKKFDKLEHHIEKEYEKKGMSAEKADYIAKATAGKIYREYKK